MLTQDKKCKEQSQNKSNIQDKKVIQGDTR